MWLTKLAITRPVTIMMLVLALVIMGLLSRSRLPVDLFPKVDIPYIFISTIYVGTGPEEMETLITKPIEDQVSSISGLKKITSTSSEGVSSIRMEFEIGTNLDTATSDIRSKIDALRNSLPTDALAPVVIKLDIGAIPVLSLSVSSDRRESKDVRLMADDILKDRLSQIAGVAAVAVSGGTIREIRVEVDKSRLEAYGLSILQVVNALQTENLNLPSGSIEEALRTSAVRVMGEFTSPDQILDVRIPNAQGNPNLSIRDIVVENGVRDTTAKPTTYTRVNGGSSVALSIQKQSDANTVKVVDDVYKELETLTGKPYTDDGKNWKPEKARQMKEKATLQPDYDITVAMDQSTFIRDTLHDVYTSLFEGALLAVLIVFLFLHTLRGTLIVGLAIPTSMISTFLMMDIFGFSMNMLSMLGLSLCVGILVDDSIVVIENIHRHLKLGEPPKEAAINGRTEIGLAAMTITLVDVVVFVPIAFMSGIVGQMFRQFGIVVATATLFSLFISFTLTPMLASRWLKSHEEEEKDEEYQQQHPGLFRRFTNAWEFLYGKVDNLYRQVLAWALDHRPVVICLGIMTLLASFTVAMLKPNTLQCARTLPLLLLCLVIIYLIWFGISLLTGWLRWLLGFLALIFSIVFVTFVSIIVVIVTGAFSWYLWMLGLILMFGIIAYKLSAKIPSGIFSSRSSAAIPLFFITAILVLTSLYPGKFGFEFSPKVDRRQFTISIEREVGTSLDITDTTTRMIEDTLTKDVPETKTIFTSVGSTSASMFGGGGGGSDVAQMSVELKSDEDYHLTILDKLWFRLGIKDLPYRSTDDIVKLINEKYAHVPGTKIICQLTQSMGGGGAPITIEVSGPDLTLTQQAAEKVEQIVKNTAGTYGVELSSRQGRPELQAHIDRDRAAQYGISVASIAAALRTSLEGDTTIKYREGGKEYDIRVSLPESQRQVTSQVPGVIVGASASGHPIYLSEVVHLKPATGPTKIERANRQRSVTVNGQIAPGYQLGNLQQQINSDIAKLDLPGIMVNWAGQAQMMADSMKSMTSALMLSIVLVFMLMAALFESVLAPLIIMLAVPQAMAGALFAMIFLNKSLSIFSMIGIIMLVGLVTKNAILLVDYTNTLRREHGYDRRSALKQAGPIRLHPILMTTMAMIFGMLPTAVALAKGSEMRQPLAITVIGGLILSLLLTLVMVPVFYEIMDDIGIRYEKIKIRLFGAKSRPEESVKSER